MIVYLPQRRPIISSNAEDVVIIRSIIGTSHGATNNNNGLDHFESCGDSHFTMTCIAKFSCLFGCGDHCVSTLSAKWTLLQVTSWGQAGNLERTRRED